MKYLIYILTLFAVGPVGLIPAFGQTGQQIIDTGEFPADGLQHTFTWAAVVPYPSASALYIQKVQIWTQAPAGTLSWFGATLTNLTDNSIVAMGEWSDEHRDGHGGWTVRSFDQDLTFGNYYPLALTAGAVLQLTVTATAYPQDDRKQRESLASGSSDAGNAPPPINARATVVIWHQ